jgi:glucokinase
VPGPTAQSLPGGADDANARSPDRDFVLGIDFGGTKTAIGTADLDGELLESTRLETDAARGAMQAVERALIRAQELVAVTGHARGGRCLAVGAVSPGIVYPDRVALAPNVPGWEQLRLPELLAEGLGETRSEIATDVKAAALAELRWGSLRDADPAILIILGTGLAAAIVVGGEVLHGANGAAGEIGYTLRGMDGELGAAHGGAPLEELAGGRAIGERASALLGGSLTAADVFAHPDPRARGLIEETFAELALYVANMAIVVDPERIAVGGGLMSHRDLVLSALDERLRAAVPFPPALVPARFIHDGSLRGAIALALDAVVAMTQSEEEQ